VNFPSSQRLGLRPTTPWFVSSQTNVIDLPRNAPEQNEIVCIWIDGFWDCWI